MIGYTVVPKISVIGPYEAVKLPDADERNRKPSFPQRGSQYKSTPGMANTPGNAKVKSKKK